MIALHRRARHVLPAASALPLALALVLPGAALADGPATRTVRMAFDLLGDAAEQHFHDVGADGAVRYGIGRVTGEADLEGLPVEVASEFTIRYVDGSGPFSGWLTLADGQGSELGFAYEGFTERRDTGSTITGVVSVTGGSGIFADVTGTGRLEAFREGPVGTATHYELVVDLAGLPETTERPVFEDQTAAGEDLFTAYSDLLVAKDVDGLRDLLDPAFLVVRGNGSYAGRDAYLAALPDLRSYAFSDVEEVRADDVVALRLIVTSDLVVNGEPFRTDPAPMLASFRWQEGRWHLVAQGNFNLPK